MTIHHFPTNGPSGDAGWPVFDHPRDDESIWHVQREIEIIVRVDSIDQFVRMPIRIVFVDDGLSGYRLEFGPYSVEGPDACALANMIVQYGEISETFGRQS